MLLELEVPCGMGDRSCLSILAQVDRIRDCWMTVGTALSIILLFITFTISISIGENGGAPARWEFKTEALKNVY